MSKVMVRYKVKPERAKENEQLIRAVYEELQSTAPDGLRYATFRMDDGVSFLHIASNEEITAFLDPEPFARFGLPAELSG
jgi:hypothetical protein